MARRRRSQAAPNSWVKWREPAWGIARDILHRRAWTILALEDRPWELIAYLAWQGWREAVERFDPGQGGFEEFLQAAIDREVELLRSPLGGV
jgi:hypothetical protein